MRLQFGCCEGLRRRNRTPRPGPLFLWFPRLVVAAASRFVATRSIQNRVMRTGRRRYSVDRRPCFAALIS